MELLDLTSKATATGPLCDACLGRLVADRSFGLTNTERGRSLRITHALKADEPYSDPTDDERCWVCEGESDRIETFAQRAIATLEGWEFESYQVGTRVPPLLTENDELLREDVGLATDAGAPLKRELNREVGKRIGEETETDVDLDRPDVQVLIDLATDEVEVRIHSAFVYGRYRKEARDVPQTKWPCSDCAQTGLHRGETCEACDGTGYRYGTSVEQQTAPIVQQAMDGSGAVFHGAGREDVDALMLGTGRPFVIEIEEPRRRTVDLEAIEIQINDEAPAASVSDLSLATHEMVERVKRLDASKTYRMAVTFAEPVSAEALATALEELNGSTITQRTPERVDHRRADIDRTRTVYDIEGELTDETHASIELHGEGGLYVKELVSGDDGRTEPSLAGLLGVESTVSTLDVLAVEGESEPFADPAFLR
ncbi:tRNA pseudouridine(54/55) synthase Pus10 [Halocatena halophila]|uniref:tRNA pseudouridine(54/55) synthase Pus10 n=1 Tax=Halocatena halophila TaxID=2814576 RepID=UPI002ED10D85